MVVANCGRRNFGTLVALGAGSHTLRVAFETGDTNLNYVDIAPGTLDLPARIEAENYQRANESSPATNAGGACDRGDGVDKETSSDAGGGCNVNTTTAGEWLEYDVKVAQTTAFDVTGRLSAAVAGRTVRLSLDGTDIGTLAAPSLGFSTFQDRTLPRVNIAAGAHILRVTFAQGEVNLNYVNVAKSAPGCTSDAQCSDANACNGVELCNASGQCVAGQAPNLDDGNPCTLDACAAATGPSHVPVADGASCDDANACTRTDSCRAGVCQGGPAVACGAQDACHDVGVCNTATGLCSNPLRPVGVSCTDGDACNGAELCNAQGACVPGVAPVVDDGNPCTVDSCSAANGVVHVAVVAGTSCTDANVCNGAEVCDGSGTCRAGTAPVVDDANPCTADSCDAIQGVRHVALASGTSCSDANACNGAEACDGSGSCRAGTAPVVDDGNPCTVDSCDATQGVRHVAAPSGTACDDATLCNGREICNGQGACAAGTAPPVDDDNPCTADACNAVSGVTHVALAAGNSCSNDDACDGLETCNGNGSCVAGNVPQLDDHNPCTTDSCHPATGVKHQLLAAGSSCSTGDCRIEGQCDAQGACVGGPPRNIDDGNPCTVDGCDAGGGVAHQPLPAGTACSDNNVCNGSEACTAQGTCVGSAPPALDDGNPCTVDSCDAVLGVSHVPAPAGQACDDATLCNGRETCDGVGVCIQGTAPPVDDGNECTADQCDPTLGVSHTALANGFPCDDDNPCNGEEICNGAGQCKSGTLPVLDDANPCTVDSCDVSSGVRHVAVADGTSCSAADACHAAAVCGAGLCQAGAAVALDDGDPCTADSCSSQGGIIHAALAAGSSCSNGDACDGAEVCNAAGACTPGVAPAVDDGNPCTSDSCDAIAGVRHVPVAIGTACADGDACNGAEACNASGVCAPGTAPIVDDGNPCTTDSCDALLGPRHTPLVAGTSCSDGNACNGLEACSASGVCQAGSAPQLDDGNPCTVDSCSPGAGSVQHTPLPVGSSCPDQNLCNGAETCNAVGACSAGPPMVVDDGNPCTADSCDPLSGVRHVPLTTHECQARAGWAQMLSSQPSPRDGAAGAFIGTGELLLFGGDNAGAALGDAWLWSPVTRSWRRVASGPAARAGAAMAYDAQRRVAVLFGGADAALPTAAYLNDVWEYDVSADNWTQRIANGEAPAGRALAAFAFDSSRGRALLFGGVSGNAFADTWEWNAAQARWTQLGASGPSERYGAAFAFDAATGTYALFGGSPGNASGALDDSWTLNAVSGVWQRLLPAQKPPARAGAALAFDPAAGHFVLVGGTGAPSPRFDDTWELDAASSSWQQLQLDRAPSADTGGVLGFDAQTSRLTFASGLSYSASGAFTPQSSAVWQLDRQAARWTDRASRQAPTELRLGAAFDSKAQAIVALGPVPPPERPLMWSFEPRTSQWSAQDITDVDHPFSDGDFGLPQPGTTNLIYSAPLSRLISVSSDKLLEFDGTAWSRRCNFADVAQGPPQLASAGIAFDAATQRIYELGGRDVGVLGSPRNNQTYRIDAATCTAELVPAVFPTPKSLDDSVAVWDSNRGRLIQFGGAELVDYSAETWEFDPGALAWTKLTGTAPPGRSQAAALYDPVRRRVILHGGFNASGRLYDTWELDPEARVWTQLQTSGPSPGELAALVFDEVRQAPALVSTRGAVWHLLAGVWNADLNPIAPSARSGMSGGWSPTSGLGMFFGGTSGDGQRDFLGDLWLWRDGWRGVYPGAEGNSLIASGQGTAFLNNVPSARTGHVFATGLVFNSAHTALLFGGEGASDQFFGLFADTWTFDESTMQWHAQPKSLAPPPQGRTGHAISVVPTRGYLMFGGLTREKVQIGGGLPDQRNFYKNDTWLWQPSPASWTSISSSAVPSPRYGHAMVTDESTNEIILFGGRTADGVSGETWALSASSVGTSSAVWRKLSPPTSPLPRFGHSMAYDPVRRKVVLSGGEGSSPSQVFGDTWEWDSSTQRWTQRNTQPFDPRVGHVTFFDRTLGQLIAFGGFAPNAGGQYALTFGDTLAFIRASETDAATGFASGARCAAAGDCASGNCIDGFCCNSVCPEQCGACDVSGYEGTCSPVRGLPHGTRASCDGDGDGDGSECANQCDGIDQNACHLPAAGKACGPATGCNPNDVLVAGQGTCNGAGACQVPAVSCLPYACCALCSPTACFQDCASGSDFACGAGYKCNNRGPPPYGVCYKPTKILSFTANPPQPVVGIPVTLTVTVTEPNTEYAWSSQIGGTLNTDVPCTGSTCVWTPTADQVGQTAFWLVRVDAAPEISRLDDDSRTLMFTVGQP